MEIKKGRIQIVDALRGFALLLIIILHYIEHFDLDLSPKFHFLFSSEIDHMIRNSISWFIKGKAYSIFAFLFGFSFYIQMSNKEKVGIDFRWKFLWRLTILLIIGVLHSVFYQADILHMYAIFGIFLLALYKVNTKTLWVVAIFLLAQIPILAMMFSSPFSVYLNLRNLGSIYYEQGMEIWKFGNLYDVAAYNIWKGKIVVWGWFLDSGRLMEIPAWFLLGFIVGRKKIFEEIEKYQKLLIKLLITSIIVYVLIKITKKGLLYFHLLDNENELLNTLLLSYTNIFFSIVMSISFILVYQKFKRFSFFRLFESYGKMSLTNYVSQSVLGVVLFYNYGFGMYRYLGAGWSLILGVGIFITQSFISRWWITKFYFGPLEWLWRALTYMDFKTKFIKSKKLELQYIDSNISKTS